MDSNLPKSQRSQREQKMPWRKSGNSGFAKMEPAKMEPAKMGLEMPDWLISSPVGDEPCEALTPAPAGMPSAPGALPSESTPTPNTCAQARTILEGMKVVCICKGIRKSVFWKALDKGTCTKEEVNRLTGSGSGGCQGRRCGPRIIEMLRDFFGS